MKKLINGFLGILLGSSMIAAVGCQEFGIDSQPAATPNLVDDAASEYVMIAESAASVVFNISANTPWRIDCDQTWCHVTPSMSATSSLVSEVKVSVDDNLTTVPRTAVLTISAPGAEFEKKVTVFQASKGNCDVSTLSDLIEAEGGEATFYIYTNKAWEYRAISGELTGRATLEGAAVGVASAEDVDEVMMYVLHIDVPANLSVNRTLSFKIITAAGEYERTIGQKGVTLELGQEEAPTFETPNPGEEVTFLVKANVSGWKAAVAEEDADWLEIVSYDNAAGNGTVTVKTKGGANPYLQPRCGIVNLTYEDAVGVIEVYQPTIFNIVNGWQNYMDFNDDMSVTIRLDGAIETRMFITKETLGSLGTWTFEFDPARAKFEEAHLYTIISTDGGETGDYYRSGITPHVVQNYGAGIYNNFVQKNGSFGNGRWNFDGVGVNGTPTSTDPNEIMPFEDVKNHFEKVEFKFGADGLTCTFTANGKSYSKLLPAGDAEKYNALIPTCKVSFMTIKAGASNANGSHAAHTGNAGEYVTIKKAYFTPAK